MDDLATNPCAGLATARQVLLTTRRRDGRTVGTPVHLVVDGDRILVRTYAPSGKLKRIRNDPRVELAPCTIRGHVTGRSVAATARVLEGEESDRAAAQIAQRYPFIHGRLIPWYHRRKGLATTHMELRPR